MLSVKAMKAGYYNGVVQEEGNIFNLVARSGFRWVDKYNRRKEEYVMTPEEQFSEQWMELLEELPDPVDAPKIVYIEKPENKTTKKSTKKATSKAIKKDDDEEEAAESDNTDKVI